nr:DUF397 domain-containing protein [Actinomadura oligospora]
MARPVTGWRKSSYSGTGNADCVELAALSDNRVRTSPLNASQRSPVNGRRLAAKRRPPPRPLAAREDDRLPDLRIRPSSHARTLAPG